MHRLATIHTCDVTDDRQCTGNKVQMVQAFTCLG